MVPAILRPQWLDRSVANSPAVMSCLPPYDSSLMEAFLVSSRMSSVTNNGPELLKPAEALA
jgi:putative SOS response-associated peptidase YedK